ncbi:MAG: hypothetical protein ACOC9Y_03850 [Chloroflexota bacterium]
MSMNQMQSNEARETAKQLAHRLIDDPDFGQQVKDNPVATLTAAGLPEEGVDEFLGQFPAMAEVSGYQLEAAGCKILSCIVGTVTL